MTASIAARSFARAPNLQRHVSIGVVHVAVEEQHTFALWQLSQALRNLRTGLLSWVAIAIINTELDSPPKVGEVQLGFGPEILGYQDLINGGRI